MRDDLKHKWNIMKRKMRRFETRLSQTLDGLSHLWDTQWNKAQWYTKHNEKIHNGTQNTMRNITKSSQDQIHSYSQQGTLCPNWLVCSKFVASFPEFPPTESSQKWSLLSVGMGAIIELTPRNCHFWGFSKSWPILLISVCEKWSLLSVGMGQFLPPK